VLLGAAASEARLKQADWTGVSVLHLAAHARTEEWGLLNAAVHLAPGSTEDGQFRPEEIAFTRIPVELVVLSGCRTTGGVVAFGEGIQGLVNPFLEAGARAVLATYWQVSDQRILPLVERFYTELRRGASAREALATAKRAVLAAGHPPAVWAAFALTGDGDVRPLAKAP
jgi:CHAT domain-containing protein